MFLRRTVALTLITGSTFALAPSAWARGDEGVDLPVRRITLYRSGVGYFEHAGKVQGDTTIRLRFETDDINDILKSMTLVDLGGGKIGTVSYGSKEPLERRLASFGVDITRANNINELFQQLRGAKLRVATADGTLDGTILGLENRMVVENAGDNAAVVNQPHVNLVTERGIRSVNIARITSFELLDEQLAEELGLALGALAEQRAERLKTVDLQFLGNNERTVVVSYVHEMPVWKTSYRLVLPESDAPDSKPRIQGWAIVENTTDADWDDVRLSLASGRPVSFTMDLYEPIFMQRPSVPVPVLANVVSRVYEAGRMLAKNVAAPAPEADAAYFDRDDTAARRARAVASTVGSAEGGELANFGIGSGALGQTDASGEQVGGQFMYTVDTPVTLERQRSAMLPILSADIKGRRVSIYNAGDNAHNPMRGVQLTNDSDLHLMPGPIAVYDAGTYAGDAQIPHTSRDQTRLMAYAVDLDVQAQTKQEWDSNIVRIKIVDGLIDQQVKQRRSIEYSFENNDAKQLRTMLVEHPRMAGSDLVSPAKPTEELEDMYRFEMPIPASGENSMKVIEEVVSSNRIAISSYDMETLLAYSRQGKASQAVIDAIAKAARMQSEINSLQRTINELDRERDEIVRDQSRIRDNLGRAERGSTLYNRYMQKLTEQEDRLEQILTLRDDSQKQVEAVQKALNDYLRDLDVE
ncbi:MAG: hypothetical protein KDA16_11055 [Phycisphaerales bacterium]|nr:hypothetical protein [Phycisphaerales bacterium]